VISSAARENVNSFRAFVAGLRGRTFTPEHDFIYVRSLEDWQKAYALLKENSSIAVDLEANSLHYYPESICLIQIGCPGYNFIVDPEAVGDGELLRDLFGDERIEKIFHSCDYDMRSLYRDYHAEVKNIFDTAVASQFLGSTHTGLGAVIKEYLGIDIVKDKKLQQMNWGERPLPDEALRYAVNDIAYLTKLAKRQKALLKKRGRLDWVTEESERMARMRFKEPLPDATAFSIIKGWHALSPKELAIFRAIFQMRERIALRRHRPPFKVLGSQTMFHLAKNPRSDLSKVAGLGPFFLRHHGAELRETLRAAENLPPLVMVEFKKELPVWRRSSMERMGKLKDWRVRKGTELGLEPSLIWPSSALERLSLYPEKRKAEFKEPQEDTRDWQRAAFSEELENLPVWGRKR
jgi:ribonuclease D